MPADDYYGCLTGRKSTFKTPLTCEGIVAVLVGKSAAGNPAKPITPALRRLPPKPVDMSALPPPVNGTHYSQFEAVTILIGITEKAAKTSIAKQWLEQNLIIFSRAVLYRLLQKHNESGKKPPEGNYDGKAGRPCLQQEGGLSIEELVVVYIKKRRRRTSQDKAKKQKPASHHQGEELDSENDSEEVYAF